MPRVISSKSTCLSRLGLRQEEPTLLPPLEGCNVDGYTKLLSPDGLQPVKLRVGPDIEEVLAAAQEGDAFTGLCKRGHLKHELFCRKYIEPMQLKAHCL